jgi:hypothetical protein
VYPAFKSQLAFDDWRAKQAKGSAQAKYRWADEDIDDDDVADGLVFDADSRLMGVNGYRVGQHSGWTKQQAWMAPDNERGRNRYVYKMRKAARTEDGSDSLAEIRKWFQSTVIKTAFEAMFEKGSPGRKAPRSGATVFVINGIVGSDVDNAYLTENQRDIVEAGKTPSEALAIFHRTKMYRDALMAKLSPLKEKIVKKDEEAQGLVGTLVGNYVRQWLLTRGE